MHACLATATDDPAFMRSIERVVADMHLELKSMQNEEGSTLYLQPQNRQTVRSARVFIAALSPKNLQSGSVIHGIGIAQFGKVPIVVVSDGAVPPLEGDILGAIPKENIFLRTSPNFPKDLALRLRELASVGPASGEGASSKDGGRHVFMSYAGGDKAYAEELSRFLRTNNISFWDYGQSRRKFDLDFDNEIDQAIKTSSTFAAILTPRWRESEWTQKEYKFAMLLAKRKLVLEFEKTEPIFSLSSLTLIDCRADRLVGFHAFLERLDDILLGG